MSSKLLTIFFHHFKLMIFLNSCLSLFLAYLFYLKGFHKVPLYNVVIAIKLLGYATTFAVEKLLFSYRSYYYLNLGLDYRRIFGSLFLIDFSIFSLLLFAVYLCQNFS